jgi:hypothetical protein
MERHFFAFGCTMFTASEAQFPQYGRYWTRSERKADMPMAPLVLDIARVYEHGTMFYSVVSTHLDSMPVCVDVYQTCKSSWQQMSTLTCISFARAHSPLQAKSCLGGFDADNWPRAAVPG